MLLDEIENKTEKETKIRTPTAECLIELNQLTTKWPSADEKDEATLIEISFKICPGQVFAVIGEVGSGKVNWVAIKIMKLIYY